jgi:hypothetical protein
MKVLGAVSAVLAVLAVIRAGYQARWNIAHTGEGPLGYRPMEVIWPAVMAVLFLLAAVMLLRQRKPPRK